MASISGAHHQKSDPVLLFTEHRALLFTVAYEITGSVADADDVVQDSYERWSRVDQQQIGHPRAYLVQIVTRQALNKLRTTARRRETYVGPWLPEPLLTAPDVADDVVLADAVSTAMLLVMDTLSPDERAVFVLREVFGFSHQEIAEAVGKSQVAVRQIASRARSHVQARRPRTDRSTAAQQAEVLDRFQEALENGNLQALMDVLAPEVVLISDGGGQRSAALRPIDGPLKAARFLLGVMGKLAGSVRFEGAAINGTVGALGYVGDLLDTVGSVDVHDGKVATIYLTRNPDKLAGLGALRPLSR